MSAIGGDVCITVRFLQPYCHGRGEDGMPEWPPSPLRLFQALVACSVGRQPDAARREEAARTLRWLERLPPPEIFAPAVRTTAGPYRLFVPDNVGDRVAKAWSAGRNDDIANYRTEKDVRALVLEGEALHYVFRPQGEPADMSSLQRIARSITHLGWGVDMVAGDAHRAERLTGERWIPGRQGGARLRLPVQGTLDALERKHDQFLRRLEGGVFHPVPPLKVFTAEEYARATDVIPRPFVAFRLLQPFTGDSVWLEPTRRARDVAAWLRHAVDVVASGWPFGSPKVFVHGHADEADNVRMNGRFAYLPLSTINPRLQRAEGITRVVVTAPPGFEDEVAWIRTRLPGQELVWHGSPRAILEPLPSSDWVLSRYIGPARCWSTVTPVVLPGYDDRSPRKTERLLLKALTQAGFEDEVIGSIHELDFRKVGYRRGVEHADRYLLPDKITGPRYHVRARFATPIRGPLSLGSGRFRGMGVFAVDEVHAMRSASS